ncbi:MAG: GGDEF domain-containing protein [Eubacteriales bacterium]|nr:GGDEF domain-containing protein [Eubacteriales bacterium]
MSSDYLFFYSEATLVCILFFVIMLVNDYRNGNRHEKQILLDRVMVAHIIYFANDWVWAALLSGLIPRTRLLVVLVNFINAFFLAGITYSWFLYAAAAEQLPFRRNKHYYTLVGLPYYLLTCVTIVWYLIAPTFWVNESAELNPLYYPLILLPAPLTYLLVTFVISMVQARKTRMYAERRLYLQIGIFPLVIAFFGLLQLTMLNAPLFCFGCTINMLLFYLNNTADQISVDPLTRLNNRNQLHHYLSQDAAHRRGGLREYVVMIDANDFKQINDSYGHAEGDRALVLIAGALKDAIRVLKAAPFLARYGGDEFILIVRTADEAELSVLRDEIRRCLREACEREATPYTLSVAVGFDELGADEPFSDCQQRADQMLYADKRREKALAARANG